MITFKSTTQDIKQCTVPFHQNFDELEMDISISANIQEILGGNVPESFGVSSNKLDILRTKYRKMNPFIAAIDTAFDFHYPLTLSPDDIWLCIAQGFAMHVLNNSENLRNKFVSHQGKETIEVRRDGFIKGSPDNNWISCFSEFSDKIAKYIGKTRDLVISDFSTTGPIEKAASEIVLMEAMSPYFKYLIKTCCGIPEITLLGNINDWKSIKNRTLMLKEYNLSWWIDELVPILDQFIFAFENKSNPEFWENFYHDGGGSGGPYVTGWINTLFPYIKNYDNEYICNNYVYKWKHRVGHMCGGPQPEDFSAGISKVPFIWDYYDQKFDMEFLGGFFGVSQNPENLNIQPMIGWAVRDAK